MAEYSGIAWTTHTMNFWIGCTEVGVGCDTCYARELDKRYQYGITQHVAAVNRGKGIAPHWGLGAPRHRTSPGNWKKPILWNRDAIGRPYPSMVFASSLADFFDNEVPEQWRADAWDIIKSTPNLRWQILTKRVPNIRKMLPPDWGDHGYSNVGLVASVVTQAEYDRDRSRLLDIPARWHGFSMEPQIELIRIRPNSLPTDKSIWFITGGDSQQPTSGHFPRPYNVEWARHILASRKLLPNAYVFVKQLGAAPVGAGPQSDVYASENIDDWPEDIRVREFVPELLK